MSLEILGHTLKTADSEVPASPNGIPTQRVVLASWDGPFVQRSHTTPSPSPSRALGPFPSGTFSLRPRCPASSTPQLLPLLRTTHTRRYALQLPAPALESVLPLPPLLPPASTYRRYPRFLVLDFNRFLTSVQHLDDRLRFPLGHREPPLHFCLRSVCGILAPVAFVQKPPPLRSLRSF